MRYYIISGERSGDLHASNLVKSIRSKDSTALFRGTGGTYSADAGVELFRHYKDIAIMGFWEVFKNLLKIKRIFKEVQQDVLEFKPDVLVLVDFGGFNMRMAKFAKENNIKVYYYISPKIWAWNVKRAFKIKKYVDRMFVILPFEKEFYKQFDYDVDYVGNPVADAVYGHKVNPDFFKNNSIDTQGKPVIAILSGSRKQEVEMLLQNMTAITASFPDYHFVVAGVGNLPIELYKPFIGPNTDLVIDQTYDLLAHAHAAVVTSGTATLEVALFEVPQIVCYKSSWLTIAIGRMLVVKKYFSLPNLIAGEKEVVKELLQEEVSPERISLELKKMLEKGKYEEIKRGYQEIKRILGGAGASEQAGTLIVKYLNQNNK